MSSVASTTAALKLKPCAICGGESCVVIPGLASQQHLCLVHYYTTGAHAASSNNSTKRKSSSLLIEHQRVDGQLPQVQELFAEAFVELQKDIGEESACAFQSAAAADDPLALLLDSTSAPATSRSELQRSFQRAPSGRNSAKSSSRKKAIKRQREGGDSDGGFIRETVLPEKMRKLQSPNHLDSFATNRYNQQSSSVPQKRSGTKFSSSGKTPGKNPYQKKQKTHMNVWNQVLDTNNTSSDSKKKKGKMSFADMEKEMISDITSGNDASTKTCTCGSTDVEVDGNVTSRNNDMMKGEVWGMKNRAEIVVERCRCLACGKTWNEE